jgi:hypothetical protein
VCFNTLRHLHGLIADASFSRVRNLCEATDREMNALAQSLANTISDDMKEKLRG